MISKTILEFMRDQGGWWTCDKLAEHMPYTRRQCSHGLRWLVEKGVAEGRYYCSTGGAPINEYVALSHAIEFGRKTRVEREMAKELMVPGLSQRMMSAAWL